MEGRTHREQYVATARNLVTAGFDVLELHMAHSCTGTRCPVVEGRTLPQA